MSSMRFEHLRPKSTDELTALLARHAGRARILAGGTDLLPRLRRGLLSVDALISIGALPELRTLEVDAARGLRIGARVRIAEIAEHPLIQAHFPALVDAARVTATTQIRNMGTIAGNVCNASPCADNVPVLFARGATATLHSVRGFRTVPIDDSFFLSPGRTVIEPDEYLSFLRVPSTPPSTGVAYHNIEPRSRVDMTAASVAALVTVEDGRVRELRIVLGAVGPTPLRATEAEHALRGRPVDDTALAEAGELAATEARPISDVRASADYRRRMVAVLTRRALRTAIERALAQRSPT